MKSSHCIRFSTPPTLQPRRLILVSLPHTTTLASSTHSCYVICFINSRVRGIFVLVKALDFRKQLIVHLVASIQGNISTGCKACFLIAMHRISAIKVSLPFMLPWYVSLAGGTHRLKRVCFLAMSVHVPSDIFSKLPKKCTVFTLLQTSCPSSWRGT